MLWNLIEWAVDHWVFHYLFFWFVQKTNSFTFKIFTNRCDNILWISLLFSWNFKLSNKPVKLYNVVVTFNLICLSVEAVEIYETLFRFWSQYFLTLYQKIRQNETVFSKKRTKKLHVIIANLQLETVRDRHSFINYIPYLKKNQVHST